MKMASQRLGVKIENKAEGAYGAPNDRDSDSGPRKEIHNSTRCGAEGGARVLLNAMLGGWSFLENSSSRACISSTAQWVRSARTGR
jgi:hypothetical protein